MPADYHDWQAAALAVIAAARRYRDAEGAATPRLWKGKHLCDLSTALDATIARFDAVDARRARWRHIGRGTDYTEIGRAELQRADPAHRLDEGTVMVLYLGEDGRLWARSAPEFTDGRFVGQASP